MLKLIVAITALIYQANCQLWRADYFKDEVMRFSTNECWQQLAVEQKPEGAIRIAFVGDSTTLGVGSSRSMLDFMYDYHFQMDGSKAGFRGYPYLLHSLLANHNQSQVYQALNFASDNFTLFEGPQSSKTYKETCEYKQLMSSNPDIVVAMLGAKESMNKEKFTPESFVQAYSTFIKEFETMTSKPLFLLVTPIYSAASVLAQKDKPFFLNELDGAEFIAKGSSLRDWDLRGLDMARLISKVAEQNGIPAENVVDSEKILKMDNDNTMNDTIHPNEHGYGVLAQELYMKLAMSQKLKNRVNQLFEKRLTVPELQRFMAQEISHMPGKNSPVLPVSQPFPAKQSLPQAMAGLKTKLGKVCELQSYPQATEAQLPGNKFTFQVTPPKPGEVRIVFAGDSVTQGCCGTTLEQVETVPKPQRLSDQGDGMQQGLQGWPYLLHELLRNNNGTNKYAFMNYGVSGSTIIPGVKFQNFYSNCRYEMMKKSLPNFVVASFGAMDAHLKNFTEENFVKSYVQFIKETQELPSKPMVFLMVPVFNCQHKLHLEETIDRKENLADWTLDTKECTADQNGDMAKMIYKIAQQTGIPSEHVVDAWALLRDPHRTEPGIFKDNVHPNTKGMGEIAQEFFMKMSLSPKYLERQEKVIKGEDAIFNKAIETAYQSQAQDSKDL